MNSQTSAVAQTGAKTITVHETQQVGHANETGRQPVVLVHGLWLLPRRWDRWAAMVEEWGCTTLTPGRPADPVLVDRNTGKPITDATHRNAAGPAAGPRVQKRLGRKSDATPQDTPP